MTKDEALKLALEALERISDRFDLESVAQDATKAITVIKEALAQPEQEPVQFKCMVIDDAHPNGIPLEQWAKPQRTWVSLTDEERDEICLGDESIARAIEAKLKEMNNG